MKNQKIKVMNLIYDMGNGGAQKIVLNYLEDFKNDEDIELKLYVYRNSNSYYDKIIEEKKLNVVYLNPTYSKIKIPYIKRWFNNRIEKKVWRKAIEDYKPNIVHVHISELLLSTIDAIVSNDIKIRFDTLHSNPLRYKRRKLKIIRKAFQEENFIPICLTQEQANVAKDYYGFNRYEIVRNGIDIEKIKKSIISREQARKMYNIPNDAYLIIGVGRLNRIKKFDLLIDSFKLVLDRNPKAFLIIAGDGNELKRLQNKVERYKLKEKILFVGYQENVIPLYCAADILGMTSISEGSPLVLIEAQICGLRCVISDGVTAESIVTNKVKKMKKDATIKEWADALTDITYQGKAIYEPDTYEVHAISRKMKKIYLKHWKEYKNNEK